MGGRVANGNMVCPPEGSTPGKTDSGVKVGWMIGVGVIVCVGIVIAVFVGAAVTTRVGVGVMGCPHKPAPEFDPQPVETTAKMAIVKCLIKFFHFMLMTNYILVDGLGEG